MTIKLRLYLLCAFASIGLLLTTAVTSLQLGEISRAEDSIQTVAAPLASLVNNIAYQSVDARRAALFYLLDADAAHRQQLAGQISTARSAIDRDFDELGKLASERV